MERSSGKEDLNPYKLLDLISHGCSDGGGGGGRRRSHGCSDDKKLELRLGLPGDEEEEEENWSNTNNNSNKKPKEKDGLISLGGYFASVTHGNSSTTQQQQGYPAAAAATPAPASASWGFAKESSQPCSMKNKAFSPPSATTAVPNTSQKRAAPAPVVGWPPIRTFRKNLASTNAGKSVPVPPSATPSTKANEKTTENHTKGLFVKINMDGVPIGRKVDLSAYDSYEKLSSAVDGLFRGLLAARNDSSGCGTENKQEEKAITGLLDANGEYTLVYEDNEGDRMLAGDVPWQMFVSTVKRLRVLKSSELSKLNKIEGRVQKQPNDA